MCRNIKMLFNFDPPVTDEESSCGIASVCEQDQRIHKALQGQRSGISRRCRRNRPHLYRALLASLETNAPPRNREEEAAKAKGPRRIRRFRDREGAA